MSVKGKRKRAVLKGFIDKNKEMRVKCMQVDHFKQHMVFIQFNTANLFTYFKYNLFRYTYMFQNCGTFFIL